MKCVVCGCTDENACVYYDELGMEERTCSWAHTEGQLPICSFCAEEDDVDELVTPRTELILPGDPEFHL